MGGNILGTALASHMSGRANRAIRGDLRDQQNYLQGLMDEERHGNAFMRPDVQAMLSQIREGLQFSGRTRESNAMRRGSTTERKVADGSRAGENYTNMIRNILAQDSARRERAMNRYRQMYLGTRGEGRAYDAQDSQRWTQMMANMQGLSSAALDVFSV